MLVFPANIGNGDNEGYNYPEVVKHSYFLMPQFAQGHQKSWFQLSASSQYKFMRLPATTENSAITLPPFDTQTAKNVQFMSHTTKFQRNDSYHTAQVLLTLLVSLFTSDALTFCHRNLAFKF
jgi:hypothetical protein